MQPPTPSTLSPAPAAGDPGLDRLLHGYARELGGYDEMMDGSGRIRPHWRAFMDGLAALGGPGRASAAAVTRRHLHDTGIAFNVHADPDDRAHAWRLDLLPVLLPDSEWSTVERGLIQRVRLIELILRDLYGERRLLRSGQLPAPLALASREYLRAAVGASPRAGWVQTYACDLARDADGRWVVLADQTDVAVGNGYALASRVALSHGLAGPFAAYRTRRLAGYYGGLQSALQALTRGGEGRAVVLTPDPSSASYFSHVYLARYLGLTVAQASDLTVRDETVYLKTLEGLQPVDLVLRKVGGRYADPLHAPGPAAGSIAPLGVAGLLDAARAGGLSIVNGLGSGLLQHRALAPFARGLCRSLLGEDLALEDAEAHWLGDPAARSRVLARLADHEIGPLHARDDPGGASARIAGASLVGSELERFLESLPRDGWRLVAQPPVRLATTPAWSEDDRIRPVPFALRCFVSRSEGGFAVLPGGLVRLAGTPRTVALPNGFGSKDLWIGAARHEPAPVSLLQQSMRAAVPSRAARDLLSRSADNLFWLGRYAERAEGRMRVLRALLLRSLEDRARADDLPLLERALATELGGLPPVAEEASGAARLGRRVVDHMIAPELPFGLRACLADIHRTATLTRDQISHDAWRTLRQLHGDPRWRGEGAAPSDPVALDMLDDGIRSLNAFAGTGAENMTRNTAWRFLEMGRRIERATNLGRLVGGVLPAPEDPGTDVALRLLLELGDSFMTYRSRYVMTPLPAPVLDLLVLDETNPRAIAFQLKELDRHLAHLPNRDPHRTREQRLALRLLTEVRLVELDSLAGAAAPWSLHRLLGRLAVGLKELSDLIAESHFVHTRSFTPSGSSR